MELENFEQEEIRPLLFNYIFHILLCIIIFILHLVITDRIYWISKALRIIFIICTYIGIIYFVFPIFPTYIVFKKNFKLKIIQIIKKITIILLIISFLFGLMISIVILINTIKSKLFYKECPFNISLAHLNHVFSSYYGTIPEDNHLKDSCKNRRCILDSIDPNDEYPYNYLCNYDPTDDFKKDKVTYIRNLPNDTLIQTKNQLICSRIYNYNDILFNNKELYNYLDLCYFFTEFYFCERFDTPKKTYRLGLNIICPDSNYLFLIYILTALIFVINMIIIEMILRTEMNSLSDIIDIISVGVRKNKSNHSTAKSSIESNKEETFKKDKTEMIVSPSNNEENIININNVNNVNNSNDKNLNIKNSNGEFLNYDEEDKKTDPVFTGIKIIRKKDKNGEEKKIIVNSEENLTSENNNLINVFKRNKNKNDINITTNFENTNGLNVRDRIEKNNQ